MKPGILKKSIITAAAGVALFGLIKADDIINEIRDNEFLKDLRSKSEKVLKNYPQDRIYMQFDKPVYQPGEDIWFGAWLTDAASLKPSSKSEIIHIELISPKGTIEQTYRLVTKNGRASGDFRISEEMPGGLYKVRAYTNWQKNEGEQAGFEKELQVQEFVLPNLKMDLEFQRKAYGPSDEVTAKLDINTNENMPLAGHKFRYVVNLEGEKFEEKTAATGNDGSMYISFRLPEKLRTSDGLLNVMIDYNGQTESISRSIPIFRNDFKVEFYPEGGDMVDNLQSRIAFKVLNEFGKAADVEGRILDKSGRTVSTFKTFHMGMGSFSLTPEPGSDYFAEITRPEGCTQKFALPQAIPAGMVMSVDNSNPSEIDLTLIADVPEEVSVVAQVRGEIYYTNAVNVSSGMNRVKIPAGGFPAGVAQLTVFDERGIQRAERLVFVNKQRQLNISLETDKEKYLPREKVRLTINVKDNRGIPVPASLALSVSNDQLLSFADDKSGNILSKLLLEQDLKTKVEEPDFYFDPKEARADKALDHLLMTSGWRRFTWDEILSEDLPDYAFKGEKAIIAGKVINGNTSKPVINAEVSIGNRKVSTDENGNFRIKKFDLSEAASLKVKAADLSSADQHLADYNENLVVYLYEQHRVDMDFLEEAAEDKFMNGAGKAEFAGEMLVPQAANKADMKRGAPLKRAEAGMKKAKAMKAPAAEPAIMKDKEDANRKVAKNLQQKVMVHDERIIAEKRRRPEQANEEIAAPQVKVYYRTREFPEVKYASGYTAANREDFRPTIYWNGNIAIDRTGRKTIEFYNSDEITSFRITAEGIGSAGIPGRKEKTYFTQLPFSMNVKLPVEVVTEDIISLPLTVTNNTDHEIKGGLTVKAPSSFAAATIIPQLLFVEARSSKTIYLDYKVLSKPEEADFTVSFTGAGHSDSFSKKIKTVAKGFPVMCSFSGNELEKEFEVNITSPVEGSIQSSLSAYPSVVSDLMKGVEAILREPSGCFEQTSMSSYPNAMVMDYLKTTGNEDKKLLASAGDLLEKGYKRLVSFETKEKGYEWFGAAPAHEALTAYGLMQFNDMKDVYGGVDQKMIDRTANWIMNRRDGKGGFQRNGRALDNFGSASEEITNAYIVYALAESGYSDIKKEYEKSVETALKQNDPYQLALMANASFKLKEEKNAQKCLDALCKQQSDDGSFNGSSHSVTRSTGLSLKIETTSIAILAILRSNNVSHDCLGKAVKYLTSSRSGYGAFGSTQGTVLALKALTAYAKFSKKTTEAGMLCIYVDGKKVSEQAFRAGEKEAIVISGIEKHLKKGKHTLKVKYEGTKVPLPFSLGVAWHTSLPASSQECNLDVSVTSAGKKVKAGETLRLTAELVNKSSDGLASPIAIIGIPAGFTFQPWQLKELSDKKLFDYYEVKGNSLVVYYRQFAPKEKKIINLDIKAEIPGIYEAPASVGYLYYTNEHKQWTNYDRIQILKS